jgi:hypothetical protein
LPTGSYSALDFLATGVNGAQTGTFTINYSGGQNPTQVTQTFDDWCVDQGQTGESVAQTMSYRNSDKHGPVHLYAYSIPLDPSASAVSITLPANGNIVLLAVDLIPAQTGATQINLTSYFNLCGITSDSNTSPGHIDGGGGSFSANLLASPLTYNGFNYNLGPAGTNDVVKSIGQVISLPTGNYSALDILATGVNGAQTGTFTINYSGVQNPTQVTQTFDDWFVDQGQTGESVAQTMSYRNADKRGPVHLYAYSIPLDPSASLASITLPSNANIVLLAIDLIPAQTGATQINLTSYFNLCGITSDSNNSPGHIDGGGGSYSANLLASSLTYNGFAYSLGPAGTNDVVESMGQVVSLPAGNYSALDLLATGVNGAQTGTFTVNYSGGQNPTQVTESFDDWCFDLGQTGESVAQTMSYRNSDKHGPVFLYAYSIPLNPSATAVSITLPSNANIVLLAADLIPAQPIATQVNLSSYFNLCGITSDSNTPPGHIDGGGGSYSANLLGSSATYSGITYNLGSPGVNDVVKAQGQTISLPPGNYAALDFLATGVNGAQTGTFTVNYADTTTAQFTQTFDDWCIDSGQTGESVALKMNYRNSDKGGPVCLYAYSIALNPTEAVSSVTLPAGGNIVILAMALVP